MQAQERQEARFQAPKQRVEDFEELHEYRGRKRKEFEERIRRTPGSVRIMVPQSINIPYADLHVLFSLKNGHPMLLGKQRKANSTALGPCTNVHSSWIHEHPNYGSRTQKWSSRRATSNTHAICTTAPSPSCPVSTNSGTSTSTSKNYSRTSPARAKTSS